MTLFDEATTQFVALSREGFNCIQFFQAIHIPSAAPTLFRLLGWGLAKLPSLQVRRTRVSLSHCNSESENKGFWKQGYRSSAFININLSPLPSTPAPYLLQDDPFPLCNTVVAFCRISPHLATLPSSSSFSPDTTRCPRSARSVPPCLIALSHCKCGCEDFVYFIYILCQKML